MIAAPCPACGKPARHFGANKRHQGKMSMVFDEASAGQVVPVDATWFHGRRVRLGAGGDVGVVKGSQAGMFGNVVQIPMRKEARGIIVPGIRLAPLRRLGLVSARTREAVRGLPFPALAAGEDAVVRP